MAFADNLYISKTSSGSCLDDHINESSVENYCQSRLSTCASNVEDFESSYSYPFTRNISANSCAIHIPVDVHADRKINMIRIKL